VGDLDMARTKGQTMREGMLWFDNSERRSLNEKIERGAAYYQAKYGSPPTLVFVHPTELLRGPATLDDIEVRTTNSVLANHFWFGLLDSSAVSAS
jgi:hypothetical protein